MSDDIRFPGVDVFPHVRDEVDAVMRAAVELGCANAEAALRCAAVASIGALADTLLALDGLQQCDLAAALARRDPRAADSLSTTIGDAVAATRQPWCEQCNLPADVCRGHDAPVSSSERFAQNVLQRVAFDDYQHQLAMAG